MKRLRISQKVLLAMLGVAVPSLVLFSLLIIDSIEDILRENITRQIRELAVKSAQSLDKLAGESKSALLAITKSPVSSDFLLAVQEGNTETIDRSLRRMETAFLDFQRLDPAIQAIRFIDADGYVLAKVREGRIIPRNKELIIPSLGLAAISTKKERDFFRQTMLLGQGEVWISNLERGWMEGEDKWCPAMVRFSTPLFSPGGLRAGVLIVNVWGDSTGKKINRLISPEQGSAFIIERNLRNRERNGIYLFHPNRACEFGNQTGSKITVFQEYPAAVTVDWMEQEAVVNIHPESEDILAHTFYSPYKDPARGWVVVINAKRDFFMAPLTVIKARILLSTVFMLVLLVLAAFVFSRSITKPIQGVIDGARRMSRDIKSRIAVGSRDEVGMLAETINQMACSLERNMEENKRIEDKICQSEKLASTGEMAAGLAHELNTPLNNIRGLASLAGKELGAGRLDPSAIGDDFAEIIGQTDKCSQIITGLLSFARRQNPRLTLEDINALLKNTLSLVKMRSDEKKVKIWMEKSAGLPLVKVDAHQLEQVFVNILLNAVDAVEPGGEVRVSAALTDRGIAVRFVDNGGGMEEKILRKIFNPFFTTKDAGKGTGLGLSVSYGIMKSHGGTIEVETAADHGSVFTVILPTGVNDK